MSELGEKETKKGQRKRRAESSASSHTAHLREKIHKRSKSPTRSLVSLQSADSMTDPPNLSTENPTRSKSPTRSLVSLKSAQSMFDPLNMSTENPTRSKSPTRSLVSLKSAQSMFGPPNMSTENPTRSKSPTWSLVSLKSAASMFDPLNMSTENPTSEIDIIEPKILTEATSGSLGKWRTKLKAALKARIRHSSEDVSVYIRPKVITELKITAGGCRHVNEEHEVRRLETVHRQQSSEVLIQSNGIFETLHGQQKTIRNVLTKGIAGVGKTVFVEKFALDWAEGRANQDKELILSVPFRELTLMEERKSLHDVLISFHPELSKMDVNDFSNCKMVIILDGLDESRLPLDFINNQEVTGIAEVTSMDVLLTNLIKGNLLPSALLWITSRPAAANQIPPEYVDQVTEVCGFTDPQKEDYFRARFSKNEKLASRIIKCVNSSKSLHIMCHIPVFCWITAELFEKMLEENATAELPQTLTELLAYFLFLQTKQKNKKYDETVQTHTEELLQSHKEFLLKLGKLAFEHLEKSNLIFYEEDLRNSGLDVTEASVQSGFFSSILKEESLFYQKKVFLFVHLIIQEFFAALYVFDCFITKNTKPFQTFLKLKAEDSHKEFSLHELLKATVDRALESKNGHLDLFLRFLLGLSLEANQKVLTGLLTHTDPETPKKVLTYLKALRRKGLSPERCINLFQCMVEMRDDAVKKEIEEYLESSRRSETELSPVLCSALVYMLLMSEDHLEKFDLKNYNTTQVGMVRLIPAVRCGRKARLSRCQLTESAVRHLASALHFPESPLRDLDLSNNDLRDSGIELLSDGLRSPHCKLDILNLSGCLITQKGCTILASALKSNPSHLRKLDLTYNYPEEAGVKLLSELIDNANIKLETLNVDNNESKFLKPGLKKYACDLTLDPITADVHLSLSEENKKVTWKKEAQPFADAPGGSDQWGRVLCQGALTERRCYWEVEVTEPFNIGVTSRPSGRIGKDSESRLGRNKFSWSLSCSGEGCFVWHDSEKVPISSYGSRGSRVGVYLDRCYGTVSFYRVASDTMSLLHVYRKSFTDPLYAAFELSRLSTVSICKMA